MGLDSHGSMPFGQRRSQATLWPDSLRLLQVPCTSILRKQNKKAFGSLESFCWCGRWDLNPYVIQHTPLKRACLPIPALPHIHFLHQRCNMYIIRNPPEFVNPFFEKKFPPPLFKRRESGVYAAFAGFIRPAFRFGAPLFRNLTSIWPHRAPASASAAQARRAAPRFPEWKATR